MMESVGLYGNIGLYGREYWIIRWGVGLHGEVLEYMVVIVQLHHGEC